ncbi:hypothetical protein AB3N61_02205 [Leptospira sp. WS58.C1]|uniref:hypothetical protein n=1 Tax=Leptospira cinconiae TaxID=3235173 RepID=UPI00349E8AB4
MSIFIYFDKSSFKAIALLYSKFLKEYKNVITFSAKEVFNLFRLSEFELYPHRVVYTIKSFGSLLGL